MKEAFDFLISHKEGDLLGVFHDQELGDIDLVWGSKEENAGLEHILDKHVGEGKDFASADEAMQTIEDVIGNGNKIKDNKDKVIYELDGKRVVVRKNLRDTQTGEMVDENKNWVVTSYDNNTPKSRKESSASTPTTPESNEGDRAVVPDVSGGKDTENPETQEEKQEKNRTNAADIPAHIGEALGELGIDRSQVHVVSDKEQLPKEEGTAYSAIKRGLLVEGWYNPATGDVYLYAPNLKTKERVKQVLLHEMVSHKGLRGLLGQEGFDRLCDEVWKAMADTDKQRMVAYARYGDETRRMTLDEYARAVSDTETRRHAADEYMAHLSEKGIEASVWEKIRNAIVDALRKMGFDIRLSDADVRRLLRESYGALTADGHRQTPKNTTIDQVLYSIKVNHNSPYLLKRADGSFIDPETGERLGFDHRFMNTGEGAQVHGWGSYFSVNDLRMYGGPAPITLTRPNQTDAEYAARDFFKQADGDRAKARELFKTVKRTLSMNGETHLGNIPISEVEAAFVSIEMEEDNRHHYDVEIPDGDYIEEDGVLGEEENALLRHYLEQEILANDEERYKGHENDLVGELKGYFLNNPNWAEAYKTVSILLDGPEAASKFLNERMGYAGIHYDGRSDGECYVIFDENDAKIVDHVRFSIAPAAQERRLLNDEEKAQAREKLTTTKPIEAKVSVIKADNETSARKAAEQWAEKNIPGPLHYQTEAGDVIIDQTSVKNSLAHGYNQAKLDAIPTLPKGFEGATYLGSLDEIDGSDRNKTVNHYFAYPINYNGGLCYVFCRAKADTNKNRLYVHEVFVADKIESNALQTAAGKSSEPHRGIALYRDILSDVLNAKVQQNSEPASESENNFSEGEQAESQIRFSIVSDPAKIMELQSGKKVKVYRAMQMRDGKLYPPMAGRVNGKWQTPIQLGAWEQADEHPELVDGKGRFKLDKGNGSSVGAAYNPYIHTSRSPLNDQFSSAWSRPELVTVEVEVPESELTSGYKAEKAKDAVGEVEWKSGPVSGKLAKKGNPRRVILSRYDKPVRVVPVEEVARSIAEMLKGTGLSVPFNTVTPELRDALVAQGVEIGRPQKGNAGDASMEAYNEWSGGVRFSIASDPHLTEEAKAEMQSIKDKAVADGTFMKAPNGKPTKLNERQWLQARTEAFKKWFGDWEKHFRIGKLRESEPVSISAEDYSGKYELNADAAQQWILQNLRGEYVNSDTGDRITISRAGAEEVTSHSRYEQAHLKSIAKIPELIENAIFITEEPNTKGNKKYDSYRYYVVGVNIDGEDYTAKVVVGVKQGKKYYDHRLTQIEKTKLIDLINQPASGFTTEGNASLPPYSERKDTKLFSILQDNSSKILDENGEPMEVWHETDWNVLQSDNAVFDKDKSNYDGVFFFSKHPSRLGYEHGQNRIAVFLNVRNPKISETDYYNGDVYYNEADNDGGINIYHHRIDDSSVDGYVIGVKTPNQIKSATDNNGSFSENDDIRFSIANRNQEIFVSNAARAVEGIRQEKATGDNGEVSTASWSFRGCRL